MLKPGRLYFYSLICRILPETRFFTLKVKLLRWCGLDIGENVRVCSSVKFTGIGFLVIDDDTWIGPGVNISSSARVEIGRFVDIAPDVFIGTGTHEIDPVGAHSAGKGLNLDIKICDGVWLGVRSTVLPGVLIGRKVVVAAGSVVIRDIPEYSLVAGVPAQVKKLIGDC